MPDSLNALYVMQMRAIVSASTALLTTGSHRATRSNDGRKRGLCATQMIATGAKGSSAAQSACCVTKLLRPKKKAVTEFVFATPMSRNIFENLGSVKTQSTAEAARPVTHTTMG